MAKLACNNSNNEVSRNKEPKFKLYRDLKVYLIRFKYDNSVKHTYSGLSY